MHRLYVAVSINIIAISVIMLVLSLTMIHSAELSIISASFLMLGIVMLPIGLGMESSTEKLLRLKAQGFEQLMRRVLEEFLVFDKKPIFCPSSICNTTSILIPLGRANIRVNKIANRLITLLDDKVALMLDIPGMKELAKLIRRTNDISEINDNMNDIISSILMLSSNISVSIEGADYVVSVNDIRISISEDLGPYDSFILIIGGILSEQLEKKMSVKSIERNGRSMKIVFSEV